jgi:protoporphyrinogen oxidase
MKFNLLFYEIEVKKVKKEDDNWIVKGKKEQSYERLVSTIPIKNFLNLYEGTPDEVKQVAEKALSHLAAQILTPGADTSGL